MVAAATTLATAATPSRRAFGAVAAFLAAERARWPLWLPVAMAGGIAAYFALPVEPPPWPAAVLAVAALAGCLVAGGRTVLLVCLIALLAAAAGFGAAQLRALLVAAPVLERETGPVAVTGRIAAIELRDVGVRLTIARPTVGRLPASATPGRLRVAVRSGAEGLSVGDTVRFTGVLMPPPEPPLPGGFDFARMAFFEGFGAVGFAYGTPEIVAAGNRPGLAEAVAGARTVIARRILAALPGETGALAAALMTGERGAIPEDVLVAMRRSGLAHLLAISGLHLGLLAGVVFFAVRGGLALVEPVALRYPVKKWAAVLALLAAFGYMILTGATVPTQRAFLMTGLVLLAILVDRTAISMRLVAVAAAVVLALAPESLLSVSFQMSFAAVVALVATYETAAPAMAAWFRDAGPLLRLWRYPAGIALTTLVASAATAPFAAYHFNQVVAYSLPANMVAVPVTALWIMPLAVAAFALMPFGLEAPALAAMGWGIDAVIAVAHATETLPGAMHMLADPPATALAATVGGGLWLCLWRTRWRLAGLPAIAAGVVLAVLPGAGPDLVIDADGTRFAGRNAAGMLVPAGEGRAGWADGSWLEADGQSEAGRPDSGFACDSIGCVLQRGGLTIAIVRHPASLAEACAAADLVVRLDAYRAGCRAPVPVLTLTDLRRDGAHAVYVRDGIAHIRTSAAVRGRRPWVRGPPDWATAGAAPAGRVAARRPITPQ